MQEIASQNMARISDVAGRLEYKFDLNHWHLKKTNHKLKRIYIEIQCLRGTLAPVSFNRLHAPSHLEELFS